MSAVGSAQVSEALRVLSRETLIHGQPRQIPCVEVCGQIYSMTRPGPLRVIRLEDEWYDDVRDPVAMIDTLKGANGVKADIFSFWQRPPDFEPKYAYPMDWEELAVLPITDYQHWWNDQIKSRVWNLIRKSEKEGVEVRATSFDDYFGRGMTAI